jgi:8-oxo-dGTP diphosphatase
VSDERIYPSRPICGVGVIAFWNDEVLLIRRGKEPRRGEWSIPGGAVELGESLREAATREFTEECGGNIKLGELVDAVDIITKDQDGRVEFHFVVVDFWAEWQSGTLTPGSDVTDAQWVLFRDLDAYPLPSWTRTVIDKAMGARARE